MGLFNLDISVDKSSKEYNNLTRNTQSIIQKTLTDTKMQTVSNNDVVISGISNSTGLNINVEQNTYCNNIYKALCIYDAVMKSSVDSVDKNTVASELATSGATLAGMGVSVDKSDTTINNSNINENLITQDDAIKGLSTLLANNRVVIKDLTSITNMSVTLRQKQYVEQLTESINEKTSNSKTSSSSNTNNSQTTELNKTSIIVALCSVLVIIIIGWTCVKIFSKSSAQPIYPTYSR